MVRCEAVEGNGGGHGLARDGGGGGEYHPQVGVNDVDTGECSSEDSAGVARGGADKATVREVGRQWRAFSAL